MTRKKTEQEKQANKDRRAAHKEAIVITRAAAVTLECSHIFEAQIQPRLNDLVWCKTCMDYRVYLGSKRKKK